MAKKKPQDPALVAERIEARKAFVAAHPNLDPAEARKRFFVQTRAAELEAAGKGVDRAALRQKFTSGDVAREGFYTAADKKRYQQQSNKATGTGGGSGTTIVTSDTPIKVVEPKTSPVLSPTFTPPATGRSGKTGTFTPPATGRSGKTGATPTFTPHGHGGITGGMKEKAFVPPATGRGGKKGSPYSHTKVPKVADQEVPEWMHAASTVVGSVASMLSGTAGAIGAGMGTFGLAAFAGGVGGAAAGQAGGYGASMHLLGALTGEPLEDINAAVNKNLLGQAALGGIGQAGGVALSGVGKVVDKVGMAALKGAVRFVPRLVTSRAATGAVRVGTKVGGGVGRVTAPVVKVLEAVNAPAVKLGMHINRALPGGAAKKRAAQAAHQAVQSGRGSGAASTGSTKAVTQGTDEGVNNFWDKYNEQAEKGIISVDDNMAIFARDDIEDVVEESLTQGKSFDEIITILKTPPGMSPAPAVEASVPVAEVPASTGSTKAVTQGTDDAVDNFWGEYAKRKREGIISIGDNMKVLYSQHEDIETIVADNLAQGKSFDEILTILKTPPGTPPAQVVETPPAQVEETPPAQVEAPKVESPAKGKGKGKAPAAPVKPIESTEPVKPVEPDPLMKAPDQEDLTPDFTPEYGLTSDEIDAIDVPSYVLGDPPQEPLKRRGESFDDYLQSPRMKQYDKDMDAYMAARAQAQTVGTPKLTVETQAPVEPAKGKKSGGWDDEVGAKPTVETTAKGKGKGKGKKSDGWDDEVEAAPTEPDKGKKKSSLQEESIVDTPAKPVEPDPIPVIKTSETKTPIVNNTESATVGTPRPTVGPPPTADPVPEAGPIEHSRPDLVLGDKHTMKLLEESRHYEERALQREAAERLRRSRSFVYDDPVTGHRNVAEFSDEGVLVTPKTTDATPTFLERDTLPIKHNKTKIVRFNERLIHYMKVKKHLLETPNVDLSAHADVMAATEADLLKTANELKAGKPLTAAKGKKGKKPKSDTWDDEVGAAPKDVISEGVPSVDVISEGVPSVDVISEGVPQKGMLEPNFDNFDILSPRGDNFSIVLQQEGGERYVDPPAYTFFERPTVEQIKSRALSQFETEQLANLGIRRASLHRRIDAPPSPSGSMEVFIEGKTMLVRNFGTTRHSMFDIRSKTSMPDDFFNINAVGENVSIPEHYTTPEAWVQRRTPVAEFREVSESGIVVLPERTMQLSLTGPSGAVERVPVTFDKGGFFQPRFATNDEVNFIIGSARLDPLRARRLNLVEWKRVRNRLEAHLRLHPDDLITKERLENSIRAMYAYEKDTADLIAASEMENFLATRRFTVRNVVGGEDEALETTIQFNRSGILQVEGLPKKFKSDDARKRLIYDKLSKQLDQAIANLNNAGLLNRVDIQEYVAKTEEHLRVLAAEIPDFTPLTRSSLADLEGPTEAELSAIVDDIDELPIETKIDAPKTEVASVDKVEAPEEPPSELMLEIRKEYELANEEFKARREEEMEESLENMRSSHKKESKSHLEDVEKRKDYEERRLEIERKQAAERLRASQREEARVQRLREAVTGVSRRRAPSKEYLEEVRIQNEEQLAENAKIQERAAELNPHKVEAPVFSPIDRWELEKADILKRQLALELEGAEKQLSFLREQLALDGGKGLRRAVLGGPDVEMTETEVRELIDSLETRARELKGAVERE